MRRAAYSLKQVKCLNSSFIGYSSYIARPGYWIVTAEQGVGRVLGRIDRTDSDGESYAGHIAAVMLGSSARSAFVRWIDPKDVREIYKTAPADLLAWLTGAEWVKSKRDIARIIAMSEYGSLSDHYIADRNAPDKPYNSRPEFNNQYVLEF